MFDFILGAALGIVSGTYSHVFYKKFWESTKLNVRIFLDKEK